MRRSLRTLIFLWHSWCQPTGKVPFPTSPQIHPNSAADIFLSLNSCQPLPHPHSCESQAKTLPRWAMPQSTGLSTNLSNTPTQTPAGAARMAWGTFLSVQGTSYRRGADKFNLSYIISTAFSLQSTGSFCPDSTELCRFRGREVLHVAIATDTGSVHSHSPWPSQQVPQQPPAVTSHLYVQKELAPSASGHCFWDFPRLFLPSLLVFFCCFTAKFPTLLPQPYRGS